LLYNALDYYQEGRPAYAKKYVQEAYEEVN